MLQQLFDPSLDFQMTVLQIRDAYQNAGADRNSITTEQIESIYAKCELALRQGPLRRLILQQKLESYVNAKLTDIAASRLQWKLTA